MPPPIELVRHIPLFTDLSRVQLEQVAGAFGDRHFEEGDVVTEEGSHGTSLFLIGRGEATVTVSGEERGRLCPGDYFGEVALVDADHLRSATVRASSALETYVLTAWDFELILDAYPPVGKRLLAILAERLRTAERDHAPGGRSG